MLGSIQNHGINIFLVKQAWPYDGRIQRPYGLVKWYAELQRSFSPAVITASAVPWNHRATRSTCPRGQRSPAASQCKPDSYVENDTWAEACWHVMESGKRSLHRNYTSNNSWLSWAILFSRDRDLLRSPKY